MALLKKLIIGMAVIVVAFYAIGLMLPSKFHVERSIVIDASQEAIYAHVVDLKRWKAWGVWLKRDPNIELTYAGPDRAIGMRSEWKSETEGNGKMTITELEHDKRVKYQLLFPEMEMGSTGEIVLEPMNGSTRVVWMDYGDVGSNITYKYFGVFMDSLIGPDFEDGLANLKTIAENSSS